MDDPARYRPDDVRRFAAALGAAAGLAPARAAAFATHLLWFDAAGASDLGIATLPDWLGRIERGEVDPRAEGKFGAEHAGTLVLDGRRGIAPLILARAAGVAVEKARDVGVGLVRVTQLAPGGPATAVAADVAIGPEVALILGPGPSWTLALPSPEGLPLVVDPALDAAGGPPPPAPLPWGLLTPDDGWLVAALAVRALETLAAFHERVGALVHAAGAAPGRLLPETWEARRREVREHGVRVGPGPMAELRRRAEAIGIAPPEPWTGH